MATISFNKNFKISKQNFEKFEEVFSQESTFKSLKSESKYKSVSEYDQLRKVLLKK